MRRLGLFAVAVTVILTAAVRADATDRLLDARPRIAVMSAFAPEWEVLLAATDEQKTYDLDGRRFVTGKLAGKDVVLFLSGVSMVNAAMSTQQAIDRFTVSAIVFSGIAGGVDPALAIGDVVVADQWGEYLESIFARETDGRFAPPPFEAKKITHPNYGMMFPKTVEVFKAGSSEPENRFWFPADAGLLAVARKAAADVTLDRCAPQGACLAHQPRVMIGGNGVSGQSFVDNAQFRVYAFKTFDAKVLDMESAATAHVAYANSVPFIAFRSLSDLAGGGEGENEMGTFFALAAANSAKVVTAFLRDLPASP